MADAASEEEQRQIERAIALSLGHADPDSAPRNINGGGRQERSSEPAVNGHKSIVILDDSDDDDGTRGSAMSVGKRLATEQVKHNQRLGVAKRRRSASIDSSATEHSDDEQMQEQGRPSSSVNSQHKRPTHNEAIVNGATKRAKVANSEDNTATPLDIPQRTENMNPSRYLLGGTSRAALETARLARVAARQAASGHVTDAQNSSTSVAPSVQKAASTSTATSSNPRARIATLASLNTAESEETASRSAQKTINQPKASASVSALGSRTISTLSSLQADKQKARFWKGEFRPTSSRFHSGYDNFTFKDVIGETDDMQSALLATFCGEPEWIHGHFPDHVKIALVMPCAEHNRLQIAQIAPNMRLINPIREVESRGVMHIKLALLYHKTYLRVVVATANMIDYDWSTIENAAWVQDFPRTAIPTDPETSPFLQTLLRAHKSLGTPTELYKNALLNFDYSAASDVRLVLSVPGSFKSPTDLARTGHTGLSRALQELKLVMPQQGMKMEVEAQGSSIGSYSLDWMQTFYRSCYGWDPKSPNIKTRSSKQVMRFDGPGQWPDLKIVYPTFKTVKESINGVQGGGTIFCPLEYWRKPKFPTQLFRDSRSKREGLLQHTKMLLAVASKAPAPAQNATLLTKYQSKASQEAVPAEPYGWLYLGSHNFTPGAWGRYSEKTGNLFVANHELGVVVPIRGSGIEGQATALVPWQRPPPSYSPKDTPWDQHTYRRGH